MVLLKQEQDIPRPELGFSLFFLFLLTFVFTDLIAFILR